MSVRQRLLALFAVSEHPDPPPGPADSVDTFRAARGYLWYTVVLWVPKQAFALFGLVASLAFVSQIEQRLGTAEGFGRLLDVVGDLSISFGPLEMRSFTLFLVIESFAVTAFVVQLVASAALLKLSWELRWYMVGDEALRIREGIWTVRERTMTIANLQNMSVRQGPLQRLLGIADLEVRTAGGGGRSDGSDGTAEGDAKSFHVGRFRGLEATGAQRLRDLLRQRLRRHRGSGLGDPDDVEDAAVAADETPTLEAAAESLRDEAAALSRALAGAGG